GIVVGVWSPVVDACFRRYGHIGSECSLRAGFADLSPGVRWRGGPDPALQELEVRIGRGSHGRRTVRPFDVQVERGILLGEELLAADDEGRILFRNGAPGL